MQVEKLKRDFVEVSPGRFEEINVLSRGTRKGGPVWIPGECKTRHKKRDVDSFLKKIQRLEHLFPGEKIFVAATHQTSPQVRAYLEEKGIKLYFSCQFKIPVSSVSCIFDVARNDSEACKEIADMRPGCICRLYRASGKLCAWSE
ncbi:hypothetical protein [Thermodesulforhabdus norvegica]|uniref:Uncharacterized protein n=1 Tax=Thermodesulforhabdus norvegica TaxID=39841 RepID=A0A1I4T718_9BACT|nr:hypothetical protein [Thermodesulforhabdus norvegica]SFM72393.1 hypothetical protein SAMN05660836_01260 [Thermodesulforhabdus norvegica]